MRLVVTPYSSTEVSIKIKDQQNEKWELPEEAPFPNDKERNIYKGETIYSI